MGQFRSRYQTDIKSIISCLVLFFLCVLQLSFSQQAKTIDDKSKWSIKVVAKPSDPNVILEFSVLEPGLVMIKLTSGTGEPFLIPLSSFKLPGKYSVQFDASTLPRGSYYIELLIGSDHHRVSSTSLARNPNGESMTNSKAEISLHNGVVYYASPDPERSLRLFDSLMAYYPHYIDRFPTMEDAVFPTGTIRDSASVFALVAQVDSVMHSPWTNLHIGIASTYWQRFRRLGLSHLEKALAHANEVPLEFRDGFVFKCYYHQAKIYAALADTDNIESAIVRGLDAFQRIPTSSGIAKNHMDFDLLLLLGSLKERHGDFQTAIGLYRSVLSQDSSNTSALQSLQRAYESHYGSDQGFDVFRKEVLLNPVSNPSADKQLDLDIGKPFGPFRLATLDGKQVQSSDIKGMVTVINYWAFWCGNCLPERSVLNELYKEFKDKGLATLGFHYPVGRTVSIEDDKASIRKVSTKSSTIYPDLIMSEQQEFNGGIEVHAVPTTVVLDRNGVVRHKEIGYDKDHTYQRLRRVIESLLAK